MGYNSERTGASVVASLNRADSSVQSVKINGQTKTPDASGVVDLGNIEGGGSTSAYIAIPMENSAATIDAGNVYRWMLDNTTQPHTITLNNAASGAVYKILIVTNANKPSSITITPQQGLLWWEEGLQPDYATLSTYEIEVRCLVAQQIYVAKFTEITALTQNRGTFINFSVMDWNIKTSAGIQEHAWSSRKDNVLGFMFGQITDDNGYTAPAPDIIGLQEIYKYGTQWSDIENYINGKTFFGKTYAGIIAYRGDTVLLDSEGDAILYNTQMFELVDSGHFWLRGGDGWPEDPFTEGIASWEASTADNRIYKRIAIWAILRHKASDKEVFVLNTHYNPSKAGSLTMQYYSTVLIKKLVNQLNGGRPTILMGDLNCNPDTSPIKLFLPTYDLFGNAMDDARLLFGEKYTVNDWNTADNSLAIFDYILTKGDGFKVNAFTVGGPRTSENGYLSDHNALISDIYLNLY